jgi:hypothetical protein
MTSQTSSPVLIAGAVELGWTMLSFQGNGDGAYARSAVHKCIYDSIMILL